MTAANTAGDANRRATYLDLYKVTFAPIVALWEKLAGRDELKAAVDRDFFEFAQRCNIGPADGPAEYEYLLVIARKREERQVLGRTSCGSIHGYPPGVPSHSPGERITVEIVSYLSERAR